MAVCSSPAPPSPWTWHDDEPLAPTSPVLRGKPLNDHSSFLPTMRSFQLEDDDPMPTLPPATVIAVCTSSPSASPSTSSDGARKFDRSRQLSAQEEEWLQEQYEAAVEADRERDSRTPSSYNDGATEEENYVVRLLAEHPNVTEAEARWLYARERQQYQEARMESG